MSEMLVVCSLLTVISVFLGVNSSKSEGRSMVSVFVCPLEPVWLHMEQISSSARVGDGPAQTPPLDPVNCPHSKRGVCACARKVSWMLVSCSVCIHVCTVFRITVLLLISCYTVFFFMLFRQHNKRKLNRGGRRHVF